jgi:DNA-binding NarL/FixJ family response regulator
MDRESVRARRVLLVDDHVLFREGLAGILASQPDLQIVGEANDGIEALIKARELKPDLILMDIQMPGMDGLQATRLIKDELPQVKVVMLTVQGDDEKLFEAIKNGAEGYLLKDIHSRQMLSMLRSALQGEAALSPEMAGRVLAEFRRLSQSMPYGTEGESEVDCLTAREQEVLGLIAEGAHDKDIAEELHISLNTVKSHVRNILSKLQVSSRRQAARLAKNKGLL